MSTPVLENLLAWIEQNKKQVIYGAIGLAVAALVVGYWKWSAQQKEQAAAQALSHALFVGPQAGQTTADAFLNIAAAHPNTAAGEQALLLAGNELFKAAKFADSQAAFTRVRSEYGGSVFAPQAAFGVATALAAQGKWDEAINAFKACVDQYPTAPVAAHAKYALASAYDQQGKSAQAVTLYQEVTREGNGGSIVNEAARRLQDLMPTLVPATTPSEPQAATTNAAAAQP